MKTEIKFADRSGKRPYKYIELPEGASTPQIGEFFAVEDQGQGMLDEKFEVLAAGRITDMERCYWMSQGEMRCTLTVSLDGEEENLKLINECNEILAKTAQPDEEDA